jgi:hypothetical protein
MMIGGSSYEDNRVTVTLDKDIYVDGSDNDGITDNDVDAYGPGGSGYGFSLNYSTSGIHTAKITSTDLSNNSVSQLFNVTVWMSEEEADEIGVPWYNIFPFNDSGFNSFYLDYTVDIGSAGHVVLNADRYAEAPEELVGDEYMTPGDNVSTKLYIDMLNSVMYSTFTGGSVCTGPEYFQPIYPTTREGYNYTLLSFFCYLDNICGMNTGVALCDNMHFAPQIYRYGPEEEGLVIGPLSSQTMSVLVRDPNNDNITVKWYVDGELNKTTVLGSHGGSDSLIFYGTWTNLGGHNIVVEASDPTNSTDLDLYNWQTSHHWYIDVHI